VPAVVRLLHLTDIIENSAPVADLMPVRASAKSLAYVMYTSGSTGRPKGVVIEQGSICNHLQWMQSVLPMGPEDRVLLKYPLHVDAFVYELFGALVAGARLVIPEPIEHWDPEEFAILLDREAITTLDVVPSMLEGLLDEPSFASNHRLRRVVVGGEELKPPLRDRFVSSMQAELHNLYGPTEATIAATHWRCLSDEPRRPVPIGRPGRNTQTYVLDGHGEPAAVGVIGEIHIAGDGVARGYLGSPELTAERFVPDPFSGRDGSRMYRTGDLGRYRSDGVLEYMGRIDHQLKLRGNRVEVGEIEAVLVEHPSVQDCAVVPVEDEAGHKRPVAYVVPTPPPPELWPSLGEYQVYDEFLYYAMTHDRQRTDAYRRAIQRQAEGKVVLDVGTGADAILARLCVEAGAKRVYALELEERAFRQAQAKVVELGFDDRISVLHGDALTVEPPEPVDLCVSELIGTIASSEGVVPILNIARRCLSDGGTMIPWRCGTHVAAVRLPTHLRQDLRFDELARSYVAKVFSAEQRPFDLRLCIADFPPEDLLSDSALCEVLEFSSFIEPEWQQSVTLSIAREGELDGFLLWVSVQPDELEFLDALEQRLSWLPVYFPVFEPGLPVMPGDVVRVNFARSGSDPAGPDYRIEGDVRHQDGHSTTYLHRSPRRPDSFQATEFYARLLADVVEGTNSDGDGGGPPFPSRDTSALELPVRLRRFLQSRVPGYMLPSSIVLVDRMPLTPGGKLDRATLAARVEPRAQTPGGPLTATEQIVAGVWREVLNLQHVGAGDNFFDLGGDSILIVQARSHLASMLKRELSVIDLFRYPTVASLAEYLGGAADGNGEALERAQERGSLQRRALEQRRQRHANGRARP
jgi:amino acid adenylation domain-containing protein